MGINQSSKNINKMSSPSSTPAKNMVLGIGDASKMSAPFETAPADENWLTFINSNKWWARGYGGDMPTGVEPMLKLRDELLKFGGNEVVLPTFDEDLKNIFSRGRIFYGDKAKLKLGAPSQCHANSADLWASNPARYSVATGYALSSDGCWRQHSWVWDKKTENVIETTAKRVAYFGFIMNEQESSYFADDNL